MTDHSEIITRMTGLLYPFILLFGFYIILNGHASPGGGFQGGAVLASVFITRYLAEPDRSIRLKTLKSAEKILFVCIIFPLIITELSYTLFMMISQEKDDLKGRWP